MKYFLHNPKKTIHLPGLFVLASVFFMTMAALSPVPTVRPNPLGIGVKPGGQRTVAIVADHIKELYGVEMHLTFDPALVEVVDADPARAGVQVTAGNWLKEGFVALNQADNTAGKVDFAATLLNPAKPVSGTKDILKITFKAKATGDSLLKSTQSILASRDGQAIPFSWEDGLIQVSVTGKDPKLSAGAMDGANRQEVGAVNSHLWWTGAALMGGMVFVASVGVAIGTVVKRR